MRKRHEQPAYILGLRYLAENPEGMTALELTGLLGIAKRNTLMHIKAWREQGKVHICDWQRPERGDTVPVYGLVTKEGQKDKPKPAPMSEAEKQFRYRSKMKDVLKERRRLKKIATPNLISLLEKMK